MSLPQPAWQSSEYSSRSAFFEKVVEHVFVAELLQESIYRHGVTMEVLRSEIDASGYDLVLECNEVLRYVQLKTSYEGSKTSRQKIHIALANKPSGCVIWIIRHEDADSARMKLSYRYFGGAAGEPLPSLSGFPVAKHTKGNAEGFKAERPSMRVVAQKHFQSILTTQELFSKLFGQISKPALTDSASLAFVPE